MAMFFSFSVFGFASLSNTETRIAEWSREVLVDGEDARELDLWMGCPLLAILNGGFGLSIFCSIYVLVVATIFSPIW